jgi:hypothetical protein
VVTLISLSGANFCPAGGFNVQNEGHVGCLLQGKLHFMVLGDVMSLFFFFRFGLAFIETEVGWGFMAENERMVRLICGYESHCHDP